MLCCTEPTRARCSDQAPALRLEAAGGKAQGEPAPRAPVPLPAHRPPRPLPAPAPAPRSPRAVAEAGRGGTGRGGTGRGGAARGGDRADPGRGLRTEPGGGRVPGVSVACLWGLAGCPRVPGQAHRA